MHVNFLIFGIFLEFNFTNAYRFVYYIYITWLFVLQIRDLSGFKYASNFTNFIVARQVYIHFTARPYSIKLSFRQAYSVLTTESYILPAKRSLDPR